MFSLHIFPQESTPEDSVGPFGTNGEVAVHYIIDPDLPRFRLLGAQVEVGLGGVL
jgi:hypothetical protein